MEKQFRLTKEAQFKKLREQGLSRVHPSLVLYALNNEVGVTRVGVSASKRIGGAVARNRVRRLVKEAFRLRLSQVKTGWDVLFIARRPIAEADFRDVSSAVDQLLRRAGLLQKPSRGPENQPMKDSGAQVRTVSTESSDEN